MPRPRRDPGQLSYLGRVLRTLREEAGVTLAELVAEIRERRILDISAAPW